MPPPTVAAKVCHDWEATSTAPFNTRVLISILAQGEAPLVKIGYLVKDKGWVWEGEIPPNNCVVGWQPLPVGKTVDQLDRGGKDNNS